MGPEPAGTRRPERRHEMLGGRVRGRLTSIPRDFTHSFRSPPLDARRAATLAVMPVQLGATRESGRLPGSGDKAF